MTIIRPAVPSDQAALYRICLLTADAGADASAAGRDASLFGHLYAGPYLALQPDFAWVLEDADGPCGYVLATPDSADFYARMERDWLPPLRAQYAAQAGDPRDAEHQRRLDQHEPGREAEDQQRLLEQQSELGAHADADEKEPEQQSLEGLDVRLELVAELRVGQQHTRKESPQGHRESE